MNIDEIEKEKLKDIIYNNINLNTHEKLSILKSINYLHKLLVLYPNDDSIKENLLLLYNYIE